MRCAIELIKNNDFENFKLHFESYQIDVNTQLDLLDNEDDGKTLLIFAVEKGDLQLIEYLISKGADVNIIIQGQITPLNTAVFNNNIQATELLISKGADINTEIYYYNNPDDDTFDILAQYFYKVDPNYEMVKLLLRKGYNLYRKMKEYSDLNILEHASKLNYNTAIGKEIIELLFDSIDKNKINFSELNLINIAFLNDNEEFIKYLFDKKIIDIDFIDPNKETPLYVAIRCERLNFVTFLISQGADVNFKSSQTDLTPLMIACQQSDTDIVIELLNAGADTTLKDGAGLTAYDHAKNSNHKEIIEILDEWNRTLTKKIMESIPTFPADIAKLTVDILSGSDLASKEHQAPDQEIVQDPKKPLEAEVKKKKRRRDEEDSKPLNPDDPNFNLL